MAEKQDIMKKENIKPSSSKLVTVKLYQRPELGDNLEGGLLTKLELLVTLLV